MKFGSVLCLFLLVTLSACAPDQEVQQEPMAEIVHLNSENFDEQVLQSDIPVLVDFTATWCIPCKAVDPIIDSLVEEMAGRAKIAKLDIDASPDIYEGLRINGVPTIVFFKDGAEQDRIVGPQSRDVYVQYLETMIGGGSAFDASLTLLNDDSYRRHFLVSRPTESIEKALAERPNLMVEPFENGQTPLSLVLNSPSILQDDQIALVLTQDPVISPHDLAGLGRCEELKAAIAEDPEAANRPDPDGATPLWVALMRSYRLENGGCLRALLDGGADPSIESEDFALSRPVILQEDPDLLEEFLDRGMDPNSIDARGYNALHWAAVYDQIENARVLLERGADPNAKTHDGETAADIVRGKRERRIAAFEESDQKDSQDRQAMLSENLKGYDEMLAFLESSQN